MLLTYSPSTLERYVIYVQPHSDTVFIRIYGDEISLVTSTSTVLFILRMGFRYHFDNRLTTSKARHLFGFLYRCVTLDWILLAITRKLITNYRRITNVFVQVLHISCIHGILWHFVTLTLLTTEEKWISSNFVSSEVSLLVLGFSAKDMIAFLCLRFCSGGEFGKFRFQNEKKSLSLWKIPNATQLVIKLKIAFNVTLSSLLVQQNNPWPNDVRIIIDIESLVYWLRLSLVTLLEYDSICAYWPLIISKTDEVKHFFLRQRLTKASHSTREFRI